MSEGKPLTGRKVLIIAVSAFAVIVTANMTMLWAATGSFPGLVVKNTYVESQKFDARTEAQEALGWRTRVAHESGRLVVEITGADGAPVRGLAVEALVGRPATNEADRTMTLAPDGDLYSVPVELGAGRWRVSLRAEGADGMREPYSAIASLYLSGGG